MRLVLWRGVLGMFEDLIHAIAEQWSHVAVTFFNGIEAPKILSVLIPLGPATYGIYIKWRNSGYRMVDRLEEFVKAQDKRLNRARDELRSVVRYPSPSATTEDTLFAGRRLGRTLRRMEWGFGSVAVGNLLEAVDMSAKREELTRKLASEHGRRRALAHLLLGAKHASSFPADPLKRNSERIRALENFDAALEINPDDDEALEYAGLMCLELANPLAAVERFERLIELRKMSGDRLLWRAYQLQATAYERLPSPNYRDANKALIDAVKCYDLGGAPLERAHLHEQHGNVRVKCSAFIVANQSFQSAQGIYEKFQDTAEGKAGLERVTQAIARLNTAQQIDDGSASPVMAASTAAVPGPAAPKTA